MISPQTPRRKVILIGMDGLMPEQIERYMDDIPELREFLERGFFAPAYSSPYTCTATNWTTIATGAWVGTHGCTSFNAHLPNIKLDETTPTFNSHLCQAEYFWHAAERQGKRSILINYPCAFPKLLENGVVIGGDGLNSPTWTVRGPDVLQSHPDETFNNRMMPPNRILLQEAGPWLNVPPDYAVIREGVVRLDEQGRFKWDAAGIQVDDSADGESDRDAEYRYVLIFRQNGKTEALLSRSRDMRDAIAGQDLDRVGAIAERNALSMHATMLAARPPVIYWLPESLEAMRRVQQLRADGLPVYFTMDAGPNVKLVYTAAHESSIREAFPSLMTT